MDILHSTNHVPNKKTSTSVRDVFIQRINGLLDISLQHPCAPILPTTLNSLKIEELSKMEIFLNRNGGKIPQPHTRPKCPIISTSRMSTAQYEYKKWMVDYIASFGFHFQQSPCFYRPAVLEAMANYCEAHFCLKETKN